MICPHCQEEHQAGTQFCTNTGKPIPSDEFVCPNCGNQTKAGQRFCIRCGHQLSAPTRKKTKIPSIYLILIPIGLIAMGVGAYLVWRFFFYEPSDPNEEEVSLIALQFEKVEGVNFPDGTIFINSPQGDQFVTAYEDRFTYRNASDYAPICEASAPSQITSLAFTPDGGYLITGSIDGSWSVWQVTDCSLMYTLQGLDGQVSWITSSPAGRFAFVGGESGQIWFWDLEDPRSNQSLAKRAGEISHLAISEDGKLLVVCTKTGTIDVLDASTGELIQTFVLPEGYASRSLISPSGTHVVVSSQNGVQLYDLNTGDLLPTLYESAGTSDRVAESGHNNWFTLTPNGEYLICGCDGDLLVWSMPAGELVQEIELGDDLISGILLTREGQLILNSTGDEKSYNYLWGRIDTELSGVPPIPPKVEISPQPVAQTETEPAPTGTEPLSPSDTPLPPTSTNTPLPATETPMPTITLTPTSDLPGGGGLIAFQSARAGNNDIYLMDSTGGEVTRITTSPYDDRAPSWSPDGGRIAFQSNSDGDYEIYIYELENGRIRQVTSNGCDDYAPTWSPDGSRFAFYSTCSGNREIYVMDVAGGNRRQITQTSQTYNWFPSWSPDGERIIFSSNRAGKYHLYTMRLDGSDLRDLGPGCVAFYSPDGNSILFAQYCTDYGNVMIMDADGGNVRVLTADQDENKNPAWSRDGQKIVFQSAITGNDEIWLMDPDGSNWVQLTEDSAHDGVPAWQP